MTPTTPFLTGGAGGIDFSASSPANSSAHTQTRGTFGDSTGSTVTSGDFILGGQKGLNVQSLMIMGFAGLIAYAVYQNITKKKITKKKITKK